MTTFADESSNNISPISEMKKETDPNLSGEPKESQTISKLLDAVKRQVEETMSENKMLMLEIRNNLKTLEVLIDGLFRMAMQLDFYH